MELFSAEGNEIYFKPISNYIDIEGEVDYFTLIKAASEKGETAIGYRISRLFDDPDSNHGISMNPDKNQKGPDENSRGPDKSSKSMEDHTF